MLWPVCLVNDQIFPYVEMNVVNFSRCHLVWNHSKGVAELAVKLDYLGIVLFMWSSLIPFIYYGFWCNRQLAAFYIALVSICNLNTILL